MLSVGLLSLPSELTTRIIDLTDPSTHLNLACTCSHLLNCSEKTLQHHREAYSRHSVISDLEPSTIPTLLRSASGITSPIDAWHVRHIEIWGCRWNWMEWRPWRLRPNTQQTAVPRHRRRHVFDKFPLLNWPIPRWELSHYLDIIRTKLGLNEELVDWVRQDFDRGGDGIMQMLLIVLCPRLKSLKYMYNKHDKVDRHRSLKWLTLVIGKAWTDASWPPGLQSLREVAVGVHSETWLDDDVPELWYTRSCFRGILKLPSIESLYFRGLRPQDHPTIEGEDTESDYEDNESPFNSSPAAELRHAADKLPARCSTVEHLYLDSIGDYDTFQNELAAAPKALKTYTLQSGAIDFFMIMDFDLLLDLVVEKQRQSIQSIMVYHASEFQGYRCRLYTLGYEIKIHDCPQLRQIHVQLHDLFTHTYYDFPWGRQGLTEAWKDPFKRQGCADFITGLFPTSLEVLVLGCAGVTMPDFVSMEMEQEILVNLVRSDRLPALKAIYLELPDLDNVCPFTKLIQVGWESGVDIHTKRNPHVPRHQVQFPMPPRTASHLSHGDIPQPEFDPFNGFWIASSQDTQLEGEPNEMSPEETFPALDIDDETEDDCASVRLRYY